LLLRSRPPFSRSAECQLRPCDPTSCSNTSGPSANGGCTRRIGTSVNHPAPLPICSLVPASWKWFIRTRNRNNHHAREGTGKHCSRCLATERKCEDPD
jgi:hypothetical protein